MSHSTELEKWKSYYARSSALPSPEKTIAFLQHIPHGGHLLDFGAGSGRWSFAFMRDRPDLTIDLLDQNAHMLTLPENWNGALINSSFENFIPTKKYHAIWSFVSLFFIDNKALSSCLSSLSDALLPQGHLDFTMVEDTDTARSLKFYGLSQEQCIQLLDSAGFHNIQCISAYHASYGPKGDTIPTYNITAQKK